MRLPTFNDIKDFDIKYNTTYIKDIEYMLRLHTKSGEVGPYMQFRTDWVTQGLSFAVSQTLRYVGYGYVDAMVFKNVGSVVGLMLKDFRSKE